jgi:hypothetical protein
MNIKIKKFIFAGFITLIVFNAYAWELNKKNVEIFQEYIEKNKTIIEKPNFDTYSKYSGNNDTFDKNDIQSLAKNIEMLSIADYINCVSKILNMHKQVRDEGSFRLPGVQAVVLNFADESLDSCVEKRNALLNLSMDIRTNKINSSLKNSIQKIDEKHSQNVKVYTEQLKSNMDNLEAGRRPQHMKSNNTRELARNDVVAQVLTYSIGMPENATGSAYFYPVNNKNGACIYKLEVDKSDSAMSFGMDYLNQLQGSLNAMGLGSMVNPGQQANWYSGEFDLNRYDIKNVKFFRVQSSKKNTANLSYKTQIEGLTEFECDSTMCNIDRLRNGWKVLATKCKGSAKAF